MSTENNLSNGAICEVCNEPFTDQEWEDCHSNHSEGCELRQGGESCECTKAADVHDHCCPDCNEEVFTPLETQRQRRGHDFYPAATEVAAAIPALYATEKNGPLRDQWVWLHYFVGSCDWWLTELDSKEWLGFGYACLGDSQGAEWGYVSLKELEALTVQGWLVVERDLDWTPQRASEVNLPGRPY